MLNTDQYYTGTVTEIEDPVLYRIKVDIPGMANSVTAFPMRGELDEPVVGDFVLLRSLDPVFNSYFLYQKIKENDFIGFRSNGKVVDITPDYIMVGIFDPSTRKNDFETDGDSDENINDNQEAAFETHGEIKHGGYRPKPTDWFKLDKDGNLEISLRANSTITVNGESSIVVNKNSTIKVDGDCSVTAKKTILESPEVEINSSASIKLTGGGSLETGAGTCTPSGSGGFCGIPTCPFTGAPHIGNKIIGI